MNIAEQFLYYADDCTDDSIPVKYIEKAAEIIKIRHPDWTADTALSKGNDHYLLTMNNVIQQLKSPLILSVFIRICIMY